MLWLVCIPMIAYAEPIAVISTPVSSFGHFTADTNFGKFSWRGGLTLSSSTAQFGGFSGLVVGKDCGDMQAVSDDGQWFKAALDYKDAMLSGISGTRLDPVRDSKGRPLTDKNWADAEALTALGNGRIGIAFERRVRFGSYDIGKKGMAAAFEAIPHPKGIDRGPENGEVEAFGQLASGAFIAIAEQQYDKQGNIRAWIWHGAQATNFVIARYDSYDITDLAVMPDGSVLTVERNFTSTSLPGMAIRRFSAGAIKPADVVKPELLLEVEFPYYVIDNMEGIAVCTRDGETRVTLQSDDNFNTAIQSTVLLQFAYRP